MKIQHQSHPDMQRLGERLQDQRTAMLTLRDAQGRLDARPLTPLEMDSSGALWMLVSQRALSPYLGSDARPANLAFSDADKSLFVSIVGTARLVGQSLAGKNQCRGAIPALDCGLPGHCGLHRITGAPGLHIGRGAQRG